MSLLIQVDEELSLRLLEPQHSAEVFPVVDANRVHLGRWLPWVEHTHSAADVARFAQQALQDFAQRKQLALSVLRQGQIVGGVGWTQWNQQALWGAQFASADIGYWLAQDATGQGVMTRCVRRMLALGFDEHGLHRLTIRCEPDNTASAGVPRRLGFTQEGTLRHICRWGERWVDHQLYALLAEDWRGAGS